MSPLGNRPFLKMNGLGNAIVVVDLRGTDITVTAEEARAVAAVIPYDQMMVLHDGDGIDAFMRIYNLDGSEVSSCGNGTRCVAWYLMRETGQNETLLATSSGPLVATRGTAPDSFSVDMGRPRFGWQDIPLAHDAGDSRAIDLSYPEGTPILSAPSVVNVGNPHAVFWVDDISAHDLATIGPALEHHPLFPERANISLAHVTGADTITLKVWERGAGLTLACGTAACAAAVAAARKGLTDRSVTVTLPGGPLRIDWQADDHILMTGPAELEYEGRFDPAIFADVAA
ncbi:diaminopimelate epimerase [Agaricicola taiwanensis]|uniref:Diaminopimelate epimerase n=1 Tax=Agaricicola taiwanensis TaxID=591372 RepID=A0A8J2VJU5_9RHOB|nr:diaminopimelate epimerase [Agaricicola taiwanensis]GGE27327.1 diaminopimelate epimerase [Agaricicola taiwanensis]